MLSTKDLIAMEKLQKMAESLGQAIESEANSAKCPDDNGGAYTVPREDADRLTPHDRVSNLNDCHGNCSSASAQDSPSISPQPANTPVNTSTLDHLPPPASVSSAAKDFTHLSGKHSSSESNITPDKLPAQQTDDTRPKQIPEKCGECLQEFCDMQSYLNHQCSIPEEKGDFNFKTNALRDDREALSDGESFEGKIVYNPDGSAYIIEGESDVSDSESLLEVPKQEGSIVDKRGKLATSQVPSFPHIANAFYIQRNPQAFYNTFYMFPAESRPRAEAPIMHSYRVYDVRSGKKASKNKGGDNKENAFNHPDNKASRDISTVPTKPILMCFICKLSFGYAKSFVAHALSEHGMSLNEEERDIMSRKNASAIIQGIGKEKGPIMSFLEPTGPPQTGHISQASPSPPSRPAYPTSMFNSSLGSGSSTSVSYVYSSAKVTSVEQGSNRAPSTTSKALADSCVAPSLSEDGQGVDDVTKEGFNPISNSLAQDIVAQTQGSNSRHGHSNDDGIGETEANLETEHPENRNSNNFLLGFPNDDPRTTSSSHMDIVVKKEGERYSDRKTPQENICYKLTPDLKDHVDQYVGSSNLPAPQRSPSPSASSPLSAGDSCSLASTPGSSGQPMDISLPLTSASNLAMSPPSSMNAAIQGIIIKSGCDDHPQGNITGVDCPKCDAVLGSSRSLGGHMTMMHSRNSCKTLKCPKCNWHYKYQETLEIHMKEKHPESDQQCIYCITNQPHARLARGETYTCGYKPYKCEVCNYSTTTKGNLSIHMQSDKHINNMQELQQAQQNGTTEIKIPPTPPPPTPVSTELSAAMKKAKPKPTWRCDVCNYETNVARNLRIHMTSEKHTHNMMMLQQNVKHMQHDMHMQLTQMAMLGQDPSALLSIPPSVLQGLTPMGYDPNMFIAPVPATLESPVDLTKQENCMNKAPLQGVDPAGEGVRIYQCAVCNVYSSDSIGSLHQHIQLDRSKQDNPDSISVVSGTYMCNLCQYKTNLKANFQLHCKTDKHLQRLQLLNHLREGGQANDWRLKYMSMNTPVQVRCNACDYYTNSIHKLQLHTTNPRHEANAKLFLHLQASEAKLSGAQLKYYHCSLCGYSTKTKLNLIQHVRSMKHMRSESMKMMQLKEQNLEHEYSIGNIFIVREYSENDGIKFDEGDQDDTEQDSFQDCDSRCASADSPFQERFNPTSKGIGGEVRMCPYCNYSCSNQMRMQAHILSQHSNSQQTEKPAEKPTEKPPQLPQQEQLQCPLCQDCYGEKASLERHLTQVHNVTQEGLQRLLLLVDRSNWPPRTSAAHSQAEVTSSKPPPLTMVSAPAVANSNSSSNTAVTASVAAVSESGDQADLKAELLENQALKLAEEASMDGVVLSDKDIDDQYRCQTCAKTFQNIDALYAHQNELGHLELKQTPRGPGYLCWKKGCNQYFQTAHALQIHFREIHAKRQHVTVSEKHVYKYRCNQCSLAFKTPDKLQLHSYYHIIRNASKCAICGRSFRSIAAMRKHVESTHLDSMTPAELEQFQASLAATAPLVRFGLVGVDHQGPNFAAQQPNVRSDQELPAVQTKEEDELKTSVLSDRSDIAVKPEPEEALISNCNSKDSATSGKGQQPVSESDETQGSESNEDTSYKEQQFFEDYINSQAIAENSYSDPARKYKCHRCKVAFTKQSYLSAHNKTLMHRKGDKLSYPMEKYLDPNRPFKCDVCKESFTQKNILLVHYNSVSHLHKLKQLNQQNQGGSECASSSSTALAAPTSASPPAVTSVVSATPSATCSTSPSAPTSGPSSSEPKPYKCNICKVAYSQASTLDIHIRSVLHQTKASKLQELAMTGQVDLQLPLIEHPDLVKAQEPNKKPIKDVQRQPISTSSSLSLASLSQPTVLSSTIQSSPLGYPQFLAPLQSPDESSNASSPPSVPEPPKLSSAPPSQRTTPVSQSQEPKPTSQTPVQDNSTSAEQTQGCVLNCSRCGSAFGSQDALLQHQQRHCYGQASLRGMPRFKPHVQRNLLQNIGFECVMHFNEYNQKVSKESANEKTEENHSKDNEASVTEQQANKPEQTVSDTVLDMPELNKCVCRTCQKQFSSIWVLKAHQEEVHREIVPLQYVEEFSIKFKEEYEKKQAVPADNQQPAEPQIKSEPTEPTKPAENGSATDEMSSHAASLAADLASSQAAQIAQLSMLNMMHMPLSVPLGMNFAPPLMPMMMPADMFGLPGMSLMDPTLLLAQQHQQHQQQQQQHQQHQQQQQAAALAAVQQHKRARTRINDDQLKILRAHFDINNSPSEEQIMQMSEQSGLPAKVIKHWFRNTLFKERQRNKDSPYNFNIPPSTTLNLEEYERTGKISTEPAKFEMKSRFHRSPSNIGICMPEKKREPTNNMDKLMQSCETSIPSKDNYSISSSAPTTSSPFSPEMHFSHVRSASSVSAAHSEISAALAAPPAVSLHDDNSYENHDDSSQFNDSISSQSLYSTSKRANRTRFSDYQLRLLQECFDQNAYPKDDDLDNLSKILGLSPRVIVVWFQNARQKARKCYENEAPVAIKEDEGGRFNRTPGLNYQCKKCFTVFQRYYELIKHQQTHCFKDGQISNRSAISPPHSGSETFSDSASLPKTPNKDEEKNSSSSAAPFKCDKCSLSFTRLDVWQEHQNVHSMNPNLFSSFSQEGAFASLRGSGQQPGSSVSPGLSGGDQSPNLKRKLEDDDDLDDQPGKRMRTTILPEQLDFLYQQYQIDCNPSRKYLENIADQVGLKKRVVQVWFQNTRARERKGQYRAHSQLIHKRCPFCRALFRAKSALESHLAVKHAEEMAKGNINVDNIPDEPLEGVSANSPGSTNPSSSGSVPQLDMAKLLNNPYNMPNPFMPMVSSAGMGMPSSSDPLQANMKQFYEDSLKKYINELSGASHVPSMGNVAPPGVSTSMSSDRLNFNIKSEDEEAPLDLSKPIRVNTDFGKHLPGSGMKLENYDSLSRRLSLDDTRSETYSESTENNDDYVIEYSNPTSPSGSTTSLASTTPLRSAPTTPGGSYQGSNGKPCTPGSGSKRYRTQMTSMQIKVMKVLFADYKTPTMAECELLGQEIGLPKRVVQVWFQNARAKEKKAKLAYAKAFGAELEFHRPPEECKVCNFKYSHTYSIQDHIFTKKHIDNVRKYVQSQGEPDKEYVDSTSMNQMIRQRDMERTHKQWSPGGDTSNLAGHPHLAQLHAMGIQAMGVPNPSEDPKQSNPNVSSEAVQRTVKKENQSEAAAGSEVKSEQGDATAKSKSDTRKGAGEVSIPPMPNVRLPNPFSDLPGLPNPAEIGPMGLFPFMYPGFGSFYPGMGMPMMPPAMMPGSENMFMYDPTTFGIPLTMLQIPQQAIVDVQGKLQEQGCILARYTQDCKMLPELKNMVSSVDHACARECMADVGYICKKCHMVYPAKDACFSHQQAQCYQGQSLDSRAILKLEQIQFECLACQLKLQTLQEFAVHCELDIHKQRMSAVRSSISNSSSSSSVPSSTHARPSKGQSPASAPAATSSSKSGQHEDNNNKQAFSTASLPVAGGTATALPDMKIKMEN